MKVQDLFKIYKEDISDDPDNEEIFSGSGMANSYAILDFGFFPIGSGILTEKNSEIKEAQIYDCDIMVLGNDFGTMQYVLENCPGKKEKATNPTIRNIVTGLGLDLHTTFFTNLFLGLRKCGTNVKRIDKLKSDYKNLCFNFLKKQLDFVNPKVVLCLGKDVGQSLSEFSKDFSNFSSSAISLSQLYASTDKRYIVQSCGEILGERKFILIPHPSFAHINWCKNNTRQKIINALSKTNISQDR